ncbi:hypothetical protein AB0C07_22950 [Actinoplanes missouriensis]|uniref:hypothetical protein n=1 Tax=Actinoplanes missouriensis TaxID=1866 RepID=UPI0033D3AD07
MLRTRVQAVLITAGALALTLSACSNTAPQAPAAPGVAPSATVAETTDAVTPETTAPAAPDSGDAAASPAPSRKPTSQPAATSGNGILSGQRQVVIRPIGTSESVVVVDSAGRLTLTDGPSDSALFVLTPSGNRYQIKTAKAGAGGEPSCMGLKTNGTDSLTVEAAPCDASRSGQLFTIQRQSGKDAAGRPVYSLSSGGAYLRVSNRGGLIAEEAGDAATSGFSFIDNGPSTLPKIGD